MPENTENTNKVVLVTGGATRMGAAIVKAMHTSGWQVIVHYFHSEEAAVELVRDLNNIRSNSALSLQSDLSIVENCDRVVNSAIQKWQRLDALVNNAAEFFPTPMGHVTLKQWNQLFSVNLQAPFFLSQAAAFYLSQHQGSIVNITDTHASNRPIKKYSLYCMSKAGLLMQTQALARELAPDIRVNSVAPGVSMWNENDLTLQQQEILSRTPLRRSAKSEEMANAVRYLLLDATYTTGSVIYVDGGRCIFN